MIVPGDEGLAVDVHRQIQRAQRAAGEADAVEGGVAGEILHEAGAKTIIDTTKAPAGFGSHEAGTVRMGRDKRTSVLNSNCQAHEVNNLFVVGGSAFTTYNEKNPTLTIMALAVRTARFIADEVKKRNLKA